MKLPILPFTLVLAFQSIWAQTQDSVLPPAKPKLVVLLVIEQLRGDLLSRYANDFKSPFGFNLFLKHGAYFPECYFDYANTVTASGHATLATGAYSSGHNISADEWWAADLSGPISVTEDPRFPLVGTSTGAAQGASPQNELASTLGDEVVLAGGGRSKLFGVSLKESEAILLSGHASTGVYWMDRASGQFITSAYWGNKLPDWADRFNQSGRSQQAREQAHGLQGPFYESVGRTPAAVGFEFDFIKALVSGEKVGQHGATDVLTISIASTDFLGHQAGPDSPEQRKMLAGIDASLNDFVKWLGQHVPGGLGSVWITLAGDHGVAPLPREAACLGMPSASFSSTALNETLDRMVNDKLSPGRSVKYILGGDPPYLQLDEAAFADVSMAEPAAEHLIVSLLPSAIESAVVRGIADGPFPQRPTVRFAYAKYDIEHATVPFTSQGRLILNSFSTDGGWWVMLVPGMYQMVGHADSGTTHDSPYSYDRHVALAFYGQPFVPGTYLQTVEPTDLAVTIAALLGVNRPSSSTGRVLVESFRSARDLQNQTKEIPYFPATYHGDNPPSGRGKP